MHYRKAHHFFVVLIPILATVATIVSLPALAAPPAGVVPTAKSPSSAPLTLLAEKGLTIAAKGGEATWDFGRRPIETGEVVVHMFTLRNTGAAPVRIESLLTSCHCTMATLALPAAKKGERESIVADEAYTLAPGKSVGVRVAIDTATAHAVDFRKMVWVYVKGRDEAALTLTLAGTFISRP